MDLSSARIEFRLGAINRARIIPDPLLPGWNLELSGKNIAPFLLLKQRGGHVRYKTIDSVWSVAYSIGFRKVRIESDGLSDWRTN